MKGTALGIRKLLSAVLAGAMALSFASCALFGNAKEIADAADAFAAAVVKGSARKIIKLTTEKKDSNAAAEFEALLNKDGYTTDQKKFIDAVSDTLTYEVKTDTVQADKEKGSVDVLFTMVDYEKAIKDGDCEDIDDVIDALEDCEDTKEVTVSLEFKNKNDKWLVDNLDSKDFAELFEFYSYDIGIWPDMASLVEYASIYNSSYYVEYYVSFTEDIEEYKDMFTVDVYCDGSLIVSDAEPSYAYDDFLDYEYFDDWNDLPYGEYTIVVKFNGEEITSDSVTLYGSEYDDGYDDYDYSSDFNYAGYSSEVQTVTYGYGPETINLWSFTNEVPGMVEKYIELNPEYGEDYTVVCTIIGTSNGGYQPALDAALEAGGDIAPDIYTAESGFVIKYTQGSMSSYAMPYEDLGIDVDGEIEAAQIAQYTIDAGTNNSGDIVGLAYQSTGGAMIYRRSVAIDVFGTDDPEEIEEIVGGGSGSWDDFWDAAAVCADNGVAIVSSDGDLWHPIAGSSESWIKNGELNTDSGKFDFFDISYELSANGWTNGTTDWSEEWYADIAGEGDRPVFCYFGPAWLINYVMVGNCGDTYGDWAVCTPPVGFFWGGTWLMANKDTDQKDGVAELLEWITLDCSTDGLQYLWANNLLNDYSSNDTVASATVMAMSDGTSGFLGGQDMFDVYIAANEFATADNMTEYDDDIDAYLRSAVNEYTNPYNTYYGDLDAVIENFEENVYMYVGI